MESAGASAKRNGKANDGKRPAMPWCLRSSRFRRARSFGISTTRTTAIDDGDPPELGIDHQPLVDPVSRKRDDVARIERKHLLVALEPSARAESAVERKRQLRNLAAFGPGRSETIAALGVATVDEKHVGDAGTDLVERFPDAVAKRQGIGFA